MDKLNRLITKRLVLNEIKLSDAEAFYELFSNDAVLKYYDVNKFTDIQNAYDLIERIQYKFNHQIGYRYAIRLKSENSHQSLPENLIGSFGVNRIIEVDGEYGVAIGYDLHPNHWQKGYMSEVLSQILIELKSKLLFKKKISFVIAEVYDGNEQSKNVLLKQGFHRAESDVAEQIRWNLEITERQIFKLDLNR